jgi:5'/3'-nucleotidase
VTAAVRILIANDDGVHAPGLAALADAARLLSPDVWIVAPDRKWTAASHQLTFDRDLTLTRIGERAYACSGAPADCVVAAMTLVLPEGARPQLVLAGINDKPNAGEDLAYSGTYAIAREAAFWHIPAIALSRAGDAAGRPADREPSGALLRTLWSTCAEWADDGCWLAVNLPATLPAPLVHTRVGRDKIGGACDVVQTSGDRITFQLRRGRPGSSYSGAARAVDAAAPSEDRISAPGSPVSGLQAVLPDENACLAAGAIGIQRFCWHAQIPVPEPVVAAWRAGGKMPD